jgi:Zn-dependent peptidase ImmA (M78 family)
MAAKRKPLSERFADAFAASFLIPETAIRRSFLAVTERTGDVQTADLSRLAHHFYVSVQAAALRLEDLGLLSRGTWEALAERGFKPGAARQLLGLPTRPPSEDPFPERYRLLAVQAYLKVGDRRAGAPMDAAGRSVGRGAVPPARRRTCRR